MKFKRLLPLILIITILIMTALPISAASDYGSYLNGMVKFMQSMYYQDMTDDEALKAALKGMFSGLDPYTGFFDIEESDALNSSLQGNFVGIGAGLEKVAEGIKIIKVYEGSPAEKSGLYVGDIITAVDGQPVVNEDADTAAARIRGGEGTTVNITIKRQGEAAAKTISIKRGVVEVSPVSYRISGNTAFIRIDTFNLNTAAKFEEAMKEIDKKSILKLVIDLRGNPGGYVDQAASVAERLIPKGNITTLDFKSEQLPDKTYTCNRTNPNYIIAVLVDKNTASAAEILASAIQDSGNGFLVGQKTYGKGVVQNMFWVLTPEGYGKYHEEYGYDWVTEAEWMSYAGVVPTEEEILGMIKITTGHYLTRNGRQIQGIGLEPSTKAAERTNPNNVDLSLIGDLTGTTALSLKAYNNEVYQAERILKAAGYSLELPDKLFDEKTQDGIKKYQTEAKIPVSGVIDAKTRQSLNQTLKDLLLKNDPAYTKAYELLGLFK